MIYQYKENKFKTFMADSAALLLMMSYFFIMFGINWDEVNSKTRLNLAKEARIPFFVVMSIPMVFIPMGGMARRKRSYTTRIETTRKGFKIDCTGQKRVFTWFEMKNATIIYNTTLTRQIYPRKIILRQGQPPKVDIIELDNEPYGIELPNIVEFVKEILEHEPKTPQELIGAENYCPWHGHYDGGACHVCKSRIKALKVDQAVLHREARVHIPDGGPIASRPRGRRLRAGHGHSDDSPAPHNGDKD